VDARDIGERSDAILRTAIAGMTSKSVIARSGSDEAIQAGHAEAYASGDGRLAKLRVGVKS